MKTKFLLSLFTSFISLTAFCTTWTVTNAGNTFTPIAITINLGDSVNFSISQSHNAREVSQSTWDNNGTAALSGGFQTNFGGGLVLPSKLTVGTHYYVCSNHASMGMKGTIIVQNSSSIAETQMRPLLMVYPNPSNGQFSLELADLPVDNQTQVEIFDLRGEVIYQSAISSLNSSIELNKPSTGWYYLRFSSEKAVITKKLRIEW